MSNNFFYKTLAALSTFGIVVIAAAIVPTSLKKSLPTKQETQLSNREKAPERAWLIIKYGTRIGDLLLDIPMSSIEECENQGIKWVGAKETNRPSKTSFICLEGE
tara:strand:- start:923 stop:1237 length:315 start_codon:yes stop_codon:yes gene_type:complete